MLQKTYTQLTAEEKVRADKLLHTVTLTSKKLMDIVEKFKRPCLRAQQTIDEIRLGSRTIGEAQAALSALDETAEIIERVVDEEIKKRENEES